MRSLRILGSFDTKAISSEDDSSIKITGYASTDRKDRHGDVIVSEAWSKGIKDYSENPIILFAHDHTQPIGKATQLDVDDKGLKISAEISKAAGNVFEMVKDGILKTFSVGFMVKDAEYDKETDIFVIKEAELLEVSVVSVPANAGASFSIAKSLGSQGFEEFKQTFTPNEEIEIMGDENKTPTPKEPTLNKSDIIAQIKAELAAEAAEKAAKEAEENAKLESVRVEATTAAERVLSDVKESFAKDNEGIGEILEQYREGLKEAKAEIEELRAHQKTKMSYNGDTSEAGLSKEQKDTLVFLQKVYNPVPDRDVKQTKYFQSLVKEHDAEMDHWVSGAQSEWQESFSTSVLNEMRQNLVVEPLFQTIQMPTPTINMPTNPDTSNAAEWIPASSFKGAGSTGTAAAHELGEQTLQAYKLVAKDYVSYEEEEDNIVAIMPIIRESLGRRMALESDREILFGTGTLTTDFDPLTGLDTRAAAASLKNVSVGAGIGNFDEDDVTDARRLLGLYGQNLNDLVLILSPDAYYEIQKDTNFKTVETIGMDRATIRTGTVGWINGIQVIQSYQFDSTAIQAGTATTSVGILVNPSNFIVGNHRSLLVESDRDIEQQKTIIVNSRRLAFNNKITDQGVVTLRLTT